MVDETFPELNKPFFVTALNETSSLHGKQLDDEQAMLLQIQKTSFVCDELKLFLDTHPEDRQALTLLKDTLQRKTSLMREFALKYYPYPVNITKTCPKTAQLIISQYGGPDGELAASLRYLSQRYTAPDKRVGGLLTDIGTEELAHMEMLCAMVYQLTKNLTPEEAKTAGFDAYYIDHTSGIWPTAAAGVPFTATEFQSKGDVITDLTENLAAEQKARTVYDNLLRVITDPEVRDPLKFLRAREIVHFQRFGEALERTKDSLDAKNFYYINPEFDKGILS